MARRLGISAAAVLVVLLVAQQLVLPRVASSRLRDRLERAGDVRSASVSAFPAFKLLWGHADDIRIHLGTVRLGAGSFAAELRRARATDDLDARADVLALGPLRVRDARVTKDGDRLHGEAAVTRADLAAAIPVDLGLQAVSAGAGALVLQATVGPVTARVRLSAVDGKLVLAPDGLLGGLASLTVFDDPRLRVTAVGAHERRDGFTVTADGALR